MRSEYKSVLHFNLLQRFVLLLAIFSVPGCMPDIQRENPVKSFYSLNAERKQPVSQNQKPRGNLYVMSFSTAAPYTGNLFVYKKQNKLIKDYYNRFSAPPGELMKEQCVQWLKAGKIFDRVTGHQEILSFTYVLYAEINAFYCDISDGKNPAAVIDISFTLADYRDRETSMLLTTLNCRKQIRHFSPGNLADAWSRCAESLFSDLENEIRTVLYESNGYQ